MAFWKLGHVSIESKRLKGIYIRASNIIDIIDDSMMTYSNWLKQEIGAKDGQIKRIVNVRNSLNKS